jgi:hypothetical protein
VAPASPFSKPGKVVLSYASNFKDREALFIEKFNDDGTIEGSLSISPNPPTGALRRGSTNDETNKWEVYCSVLR